MMFVTPPPVVAYIKDGRVRALVVTSVTRSALLPDVPTVVELGYPDLQITEVMGIAAPADTPAPVIQRLNGALNEILSDATVRVRLEAAGVTPSGSTPEAFASYMRNSIERWGKVITPEMRTE